MSEKNLRELAVEILATGDPDMKAELSLETASKWKAGIISNVGTAEVPDAPAKPEGVELVNPWNVPKRGKGGSEGKRIAALHSLCHIEQVAINLSWDIVARYQEEDMPKEFFDEWVRIAAEEAKHYRVLSKRLGELGSHYGSLPAHDGLWESARETADSLPARLAIVHMVHEARGLDVHPTTVKRFKGSGDEESVRILEDIIYPDEITHVEAGVKWFKHFSKGDESEVISKFHDLVRTRFRGNLKPPFNHDARQQAGFTKDWYEPLASNSIKEPCI